MILAHKIALDPTREQAEFKAACALKGTRMIDEVRRFIEEWTQKNC